MHNVNQKIRRSRARQPVYGIEAQYSDNPAQKNAGKN